MRRIHPRAFFLSACLLALLLVPPLLLFGELPPPRNLIIVVGDGMQMEHEIAASLWLYGTEQGLAWHDPELFGYRGWCTTWDQTTYNLYARAAEKEPFAETGFDPAVGYDPARGGRAPWPAATDGEDAYFLDRIRVQKGSRAFAMIPGTDSASAATAMATGRKTARGNVSWVADDRKDGALTTIAELARARCKASIGIVTTVPFSHATPACFTSHNTNRNSYRQIADEIINRTRPEVVIGGGSPLGISKGSPYRYLLEKDYLALKDGSAGYRLVEPNGSPADALLRAVAEELDVNSGQRLFGLFGRGGSSLQHGSCTDSQTPLPGRPRIPNRPPGSPTCAGMALAALEFLEKDPDGFVLVVEQGDIDWKNHGNDYRGMIAATVDLELAVRAIHRHIGESEHLSKDNTLLVVTSDHANSYMRLKRVDGRPVLGRGMLPTQKRFIDPASGKPRGYLYPDGEVTYSTTGHTNELVTLAASGTGADLFAKRGGRWYPGTGLLDNTDIFAVSAEWLGIDTGDNPLKPAGIPDDRTTRPATVDVRPWHICLLVGAGLIAGFMNVMAGGGSLLMMPALVFMGYGGALANGTARIAIVLQNVSAVTRFRKKGFCEPKLSLSLALCTVPGAVAGAWCATHLSGVAFNRVLAGVMVGVLILMFRGQKGSDPGSQAGSLPSNRLAGHLLMLGAGLYGGFIQAGVGFILMAILHSVMRIDLVRTNMHKVLIVLVFTLGAAAVFAVNGLVIWELGLALAVGTMIGGWVGANVSVKKGEKAIRLVFSLCLLAMAVKLVL